VQNECILYNFRKFAIFVLKIIRVGRNLTYFMTKIILHGYSETRCIVWTLLPGDLDLLSTLFDLGLTGKRSRSFVVL